MHRTSTTRGPHRFLEIDVFENGPFTGNPLAVVAGADDLDPDQMRRLAAWTGFSETTFLLEPSDPRADYRVRIFTPTTEYSFAGHPTLGSARAWLHLNDGKAGGGRAGTLVQECGVGLVELRVEDDLLWFATPPRRRTGPLSDDELDEVVQACALDRDQVIAHEWGVNGPEWRMVQLRDADAIRAVRPLPERGNLRVGLVGLEPGDGEIAYEVRGLGPSHEDPVTGSLHGAVAQWLRQRGLVPEHCVAAQGSQVGRDGRVHVRDESGQVWIGGRARVVVDGAIDLG